jgi:GT2 family glycosyltransferase
MASQPNELSSEVIVVDNASFDGVGGLLAREFPQVKFLQLRENVGFAKANNLAIDVARGSTLLFLNPDTKVIESGLYCLYQRFQVLPQAGAAGCKLLNTDGSVQTSCVQSTPTIWNQFLDIDVLKAWPSRAREVLYGPGTQPQCVEMVSGACLMVKRSVFEEVGRFSPDYFMYAEDVDLCYKIRKAGYRVYYVPEATVIHHGGMSSGRVGTASSAVVMRESIWKFLRKTRGCWYGAAYRLSMVVSGVLRIATLGLAMPIMAALGRLSRWHVSVAKWLAIVCWGMGMRRGTSKNGR